MNKKKVFKMIKEIKKMLSNITNIKKIKVVRNNTKKGEFLNLNDLEILNTFEKF